MENRTYPGQGRAAALLRTAAPLILAAGLSALLSSCAAQKPSNKDYSTTRLSEKGTYKVTFSPLTDPMPVNKIHSWKLHVENATGQPVSDATIMVDGRMPEHGHGLPTKPQVTQNLANGDYLAEGMKFQMRGWWVVSFTITSGGTGDTVTFNLQL